MSDSIPVFLILALSGGSMDAYSYLCRGKVFANAQTGNILLFGVNLADGNFSYALKYFLPVLAFTAGIILSDLIRHRIIISKVHWRQTSVIAEMLILFLVCWIPKGQNAAANFLTSFACGMQVESFRSVHGNSAATTMCIGNLRSGTFYLDKYFLTKHTENIKKACIYYCVIIFFTIGAVIESILITQFAEKALFFSVVMLLIVCVLMAVNREKTPEIK